MCGRAELPGPPAPSQRQPPGSWPTPSRAPGFGPRQLAGRVCGRPSPGVGVLKPRKSERSVDSLQAAPLASAETGACIRPRSQDEALDLENVLCPASGGAVFDLAFARRGTEESQRAVGAPRAIRGGSGGRRVRRRRSVRSEPFARLRKHLDQLENP